MTLLWHGDRPIGICVFAAPAASLRLRNQFFKWQPSTLSDRPSACCAGSRSLRLKKLNQELWLLARVVLHPTYRGAGVAAAFVRNSCATCPVPWIETLTAMGHLNPFFEKAGFVRVGVIRKDQRRMSIARHGRIYGGQARLSPETLRKSWYAEPVYYVFDNRQQLIAPHR